METRNNTVISKTEAATVAKRITRKLCIVNGLHWHDLLAHEVEVCKPEDSWSYRNWIDFLLHLGMTEEQIFNTAQQRLNKTRAQTNYGLMA